MNILKLIGNTPILEMPSDYAKGRIYAKLEYANPTGSVKDRAALYLVRDAIDRGLVSKGGTIVEPTSGNTGIGLAMVARAYNIKTIITMPENMSEERIRMIRAYGGEVILTPREKGMRGAIEAAKEIVDKYGAYMPCQFDNAANIRAHYETTAPEIIRQVPDVKWVVSPVGSGGTAMGVKKYFEEHGIAAKICAVEPSDSPLISKGYSAPHKIQGIGANFLPSILDTDKLDRVITVTNDEAYYGARELAKKYGLFGGISAGAAYVGALKLADDAEGDIVFIVPDSGTRYMSVGLYE